MRSFTGASRSTKGKNSTSTDIGSDVGVRYGGRWFWAASALQGDRRAPSHFRRLLSCAGAGLRRPQRVAALFVVLRRTESVSVAVSESVAGLALRAYFNQRVLGLFPRNRLCQGVLVVPQRRSDYLRGRRRHALRTNLSRAASDGISCEVLEDRSQALEALEAVTRSRRQGPLAADAVGYFRALLDRPEMTFLVARDRDGGTRAVMAAVIDEMVCMMDWATSNSHEARWALHDHLVDLLRVQGVEYLIMSGEGPFGALGFTANVQQYQHLLGYELRHVRPARMAPSRASAVRVTRKRRLVASLVVVAATAAAILPRAAAHTLTTAQLGRATPHQVTHVTPRPVAEPGARQR